MVIAAETGSGKTYAYLAPLLTRLLQLPQPLPCPAAAVLCPNSVLADQVEAAANALVGDDGEPLVRTVALTADMVRTLAELPYIISRTDGPSPQSLRAAVAAGIPIVVCTPARLLEEVFDYSSGSWRTHPCPLAATALRTVVVDEADMLLSGGFARPLKQLVQLLDRAERAARSAEQQFTSLKEDGVEAVNADAEAEAALSAPPPPGRQFLFAAATVHSSGRCTPGETLRAGFPDAVWVEGPQLHRCLPHVTQAWARLPDGCTPDQLAEEVLAALGDPAAGQAMVFANTTETVLLLAAAMQARMPSVRAFCADMTLAERRSTVDAFRSGEARVLVCTDAAARGLDVPAVSHVVQANFALSAVDFLHRVGRTARAGAPGRVTSLFDGQAAALVAAVRAAVDQGQRVEDAFSRKRSFSKKLKKYGESRKGPVDLAKAAEKRLGPPGQRAPPIFT